MGNSVGPKASLLRCYAQIGHRIDWYATLALQIVPKEGCAVVLIATVDPNMPR
jgi:hypothetical protein